MNNKLPPQEPMVILPIRMDMSIKGVRNPYELHILGDTIERNIMDILAGGVSFTRINPTEVYREHLKDNDNE